MVYVFTCLSTQCIGTQRAIKVYRGMIAHDNPHTKFADDDFFDEVSNSYQQQLVDRGLIKLDPEDSIESNSTKEEKDIKLVLKEYII